MTQNHYNMSVQQIAMSDQNEVINLRSQLDQALSLIDDLRRERDDAVEREARTREELERELEDRDTTITWLREQVETLRLDKEYVTSHQEWCTDLVNNSSIEPAKKVVLQILYPFAKRGEWFRVPVLNMSKRAGMKYYGTFSGHMRGMGDLGLVEVQGGDEGWFTGKYDKKGKPIFKKDVTIRFTEELLRFPGEVCVEEEDKRKGNGKGGGKNAKPKTCPQCNGVEINEYDTCECRKCGKQWVEGPPKDANRSAKLTPWDYGSIDEDAAELATVIEELQQVTPQTVTQWVARYKSAIVSMGSGQFDIRADAIPDKSDRDYFYQHYDEVCVLYQREVSNE